MNRPSLRRVFDRVASPFKGDESGFTLLEVMIAVAIMLVAFSSILMVESASINTSIKTKNMITVAMLAKNILVESEYLWEGKTFDEFKKEESGQFKAPFEEYTWTRVVKEIQFPNLGTGGNQNQNGDKSSSSSSSSDSNSGNESQTDQANLLAKLMTQYLSKGIREVTVTVKWKKGSGEQSYSVGTYWVNLNNEFKITEQ